MIVFESIGTVVSDFKKPEDLHIACKQGKEFEGVSRIFLKEHLLDLDQISSSSSPNDSVCRLNMISGRHSDALHRSLNTFDQKSSCLNPTQRRVQPHRLFQ